MPSQVAIVFLLAGAAAAAGLGWFSWRLTRLAPDSPDALVGQLRLSQAGAVVLAVTAAIHAGLAAAAESTPGAAADVGIAGAFAGAALLALLREPRTALGLLAGAFAAHALVDIAHRPGMLTPIAPRWLAAGGAAFDLVFSAICFAPLLRR